MIFRQQAFRHILFISIAALGLVWIWVSSVPAGATTAAGKIPAPQAGFLAPNFTLQTLEGKSITLSDYRGKVVLLNLWATWCPPCRAEIPAIQRISEAFKNEPFVVLAVNSTIQDSLPNLQTFVAQNQMTFPVLLDERGEVTRLYRVQSLPTSFFIGPDGIIREVVVGGPMAEALLRSRVEKLLKEAH